MVNTPKAPTAQEIHGLPSFEKFFFNDNTVTIPAGASYFPPGTQPIFRITLPAVRDKQISETITDPEKCPITEKLLDTTHRRSSEILQQMEQGNFKEAVTRGLALGIPLACAAYGLNELSPPSFPPPRLAIEGPEAAQRSSSSRSLVPFTGITTETQIAALISKAALAFSGVLGWATLKNFATFWERRSLGHDALKLEKSLNGIEAELEKNNFSSDEIYSIKALFKKNIDNFKKLSEIGKFRALPKMFFTASALTATLGYWFAADEVTKAGIVGSAFFALTDFVQNGIFTESRVEEETQKGLHSELMKLKFPNEKP